MTPGVRFTVRVALIVALGGFLMGFDASVISGVVGFIEPEFSLTKIELGWAVASLTLTATMAIAEKTSSILDLIFRFLNMML